MKEYNLEIHHLIAIIGRELIYNYNSSYIKDFFKFPKDINLKLNRSYNNCDLSKLNQYFYLACGSYRLEREYPAFLKYGKYIVDRKNHSVMKLSKNYQSNLICLSFNLDEKNKISFDIFESDLSYYTDHESNSYNFYGINSLKLNDNSITFDEFNSFFDEFKKQFKNKLISLTKAINKAKINNAKYLEQIQLDKIKRRENELKEFMN